MADEKYLQTFKSGTKEFEVIGMFWELMKKADTPELRKLCGMLFDAFEDYPGSAENVKNIWIEWWVIFQTFYKCDDTDEFWEDAYNAVRDFNEKYRGTNEAFLVLKLATMVMDYQQWRRDEKLL